MTGRKILTGLEQAVAHARGEEPCVRERSVHVARAFNVRALRNRLGLTQQAFAAQFGFSLAAVRHWEQGLRVPEASACILLTLIDRDPAYVRETLEMSARSVA
jgi:putative transcriptional regulator